jgi:spermidine synthase
MGLHDARRRKDIMWFIEKYNDNASLGLKIRGKIHEEKSPFQTIEIYETEFFGKLLTLDGLVMLSEKDEFVYHEMIAHVPMNSHPNPERVLVVGGGDGGTIRELLRHPSVKEAVLCEIDERVVRLCQTYFPGTAACLDDPRVRLAFEDGFKFLETYKNQFDVIVTDSSDPIGPGVSLFRESYYALVKGALREGGIMVSQSESPWYFADIMNSMTADMGKVFNRVETYIAMIPLYPSGFWTITAASDACSIRKFNAARAAKIAENCRYYNPEIHTACSALPNFARDIVRNK